MSNFMKASLFYWALAVLFWVTSWLLFGDFRHAHAFAAYTALLFVLEHKFEVPQS